MEIIEDYPEEEKYNEWRQMEGILIKGNKRIFEF
jgi:hypothetical protein